MRAARGVPIAIHGVPAARKPDAVVLERRPARKVPRHGDGTDGGVVGGGWRCGAGISALRRAFGPAKRRSHLLGVRPRWLSHLPFFHGVASTCHMTFSYVFGALGVSAVALKARLIDRTSSRILESLLCSLLQLTRSNSAPCARRIVARRMFWSWASPEPERPT